MSTTRGRNQTPPRGRILPGLLVIRWESGLIFPNARGFSDQVKELVESSAEPNGRVRE